jgi:predicted O-methyltransferase YrrM
MNADRLRYASDLYARSHAFDESQSDRLERYRNLEPPTAELLGVLMRATRAQRVLELGTSNGYSTLWLADAAEATGGRLVTVEIDPERTALARGRARRVHRADRGRAIAKPDRPAGGRGPATRRALSLSAAAGRS